MPVSFAVSVAGAVLALAQPSFQDDQDHEHDHGSEKIEIALVTDVRAVLEHSIPEERGFELYEVEFIATVPISEAWSANAYVGLHRGHHEKHEGKKHDEEGHSLDIEEASLRYAHEDVSVRFGKMRAGVGRTNQLHRHEFEYLGLPLVLHHLFEDHGLAEIGVSISKTVGNGDAFLEVFRAAEGPLFEGSEPDDLFYVLGYQLPRVFSGAFDPRIGLSYVGGPALQNGANIIALDLIAESESDAGSRHWKLETEAFRTSHDFKTNRTAYGGFIALTGQLSDRLFGTVKADYSEDPFSLEINRAISFGLAHRYSDGSHVRAEFQRIFSSTESAGNVFTIQFQHSFQNYQHDHDR